MIEKTGQQVQMDPGASMCHKSLNSGGVCVYVLALFSGQLSSPAGKDFQQIQVHIPPVKLKRIFLSVHSLIAHAFISSFSHPLPDLLVLSFTHDFAHSLDTLAQSCVWMMLGSQG